MRATPDSQLARGLEMTRRMLELVRAGAWEEVATLSAERLYLLRQWSGGNDPAAAQSQIGILQEIQALDSEIEVLGRQGRDEAAEHLRQLHQGRKAGKAYKG
jgi:hypothetical protein